MRPGEFIFPQRYPRHLLHVLRRVGSGCEFHSNDAAVEARSQACSTIADEE